MRAAIAVTVAAMAAGVAATGTRAQPPAVPAGTGAGSRSGFGSASASGFGPGARVLLDGHNAYPERGQWTDRLDRVLATGVPVAIEQDLYWVERPSGAVSVVAHDSDAVAGAPTLAAHFFERVRPLMEEALRERRTATWPLVVLNLDFKSNEPAHHAYIRALLVRHGAWLTHAARTATPERPAPLVVGPMLVLTGEDSTQRRVFHDDVPVGDTLWLFGAMPAVRWPGATREARARAAVTLPAAALVPARAGNYVRWVNFPWGVVEERGQVHAGRWTGADRARLEALVTRAHGQGLWIRFYTLDGFGPAEDRGYSASYNFGSLGAVRRRWRGAVEAGVDFVATDQVAAFVAARRAR